MSKNETNICNFIHFKDAQSVKYFIESRSSQIIVPVKFFGLHEPWTFTDCLLTYYTKTVTLIVKKRQYFYLLVSVLLLVQ